MGINQTLVQRKIYQSLNTNNTVSGIHVILSYCFSCFNINNLKNEYGSKCPHGTAAHTVDDGATAGFQCLVQRRGLEELGFEPPIECLQDDHILLLHQYQLSSVAY